MGNELKASSFRLKEDDIEKFRGFAEENGLNQAEMFNALINNFEMARAKGEIKDRAKEIEVFQDTVNNLVSMFINSLSINQSSEERIRETLSLELNSKDKIITELQEAKDNLSAEVKVLQDDLKTTETTLDKVNEGNIKLNISIDEKDHLINNAQEQISTLNSIVAEYKKYKDINVELKSENDSLKENEFKLNHKLIDVENSLKNTEDMRDFYKAEVEVLKGNVDSLNANIKTLEAEHKEAIKALETRHKSEIDKLKEEFNARYNEAIALKEESLKLALEREENKRIAIENELATLKTQYNALINNK